MSVPPLPPQLESLGNRSFSFYPPVMNIEHNEWKFQKATWSEILVLNTKTNLEIWVPRRFLGEVSRIDEPVMIVGLKKEFEYKAGSLWPHERRVIEMPKAVNDFARPGVEEAPAPVSTRTGMRLNDGGAESFIGKMIGVALVVALLVTFGLVSYFRAKTDPTNVTYVPILQQSINLTAQDDVYSVIRRLGEPQEDRWKSEAGEMQYRVLHYSSKGLYVVLMGIDRDKARYIGSMDESWKPVHSVELPNKISSRAMLSSLPRF